MSEAREAILTRLRRVSAPGRDRDAAEKRLAQHPQDAPIPEQATALRDDAAARLDRFAERAEAADATVSRIASLDDLPQALANQLRNRNLPAAIRTGTDPVFDRDWGQVERSVGAGRQEEPVTLSRAELGVAETGTVVLLSGPENPVTLTFLGETHFIVIDANDICAGYEEMWAEWRARGRDSRTVNMVTGPSRSADIGQTLQLGAHGPVAVHIFIVGKTET